MTKAFHSTCWKRRIAILLVWTLMVGMLISLSGCGLRDSQQTPVGELGADTPKIGLITGEGGIDDPYFKKAWEGLQKAEQEHQVRIGYVKAKNDKDYASKLAQLSGEKYDVVFTLGENAVPAVLEAAKKNPKIKYISLDSTLEAPIPSNVLGVTYKVEEASFLAGYLAGKMTKSQVVGFISGDNKQEAQKYYYGYKAGLRFANSQCELMKGLAGTYTNTSRIEEITQRMIEAKTDVIFHVAGIAGKAMIKQMDKYDRYAIGVDTDQNSLAPNSVITSVLKNNDQVILKIVEKYKAKDLILGKNIVYGFAENGVGLAGTTEQMIPEEIYKQLVEYQEQIVSGKMEIPSTENEYLAFTNN